MSKGIWYIRISHFISLRDLPCFGRMRQQVRVYCGSGTCPIVSPQIWNDLRANVMSTELLSTFRQRLKTHLFSKSFPGYFLDISQLVPLVNIHLLSVVYCWTVWIYKMSDEDTSLLHVSEICLQLLTIVLLLILSKISDVIAYDNLLFVRFS